MKWREAARYAVLLACASMNMSLLAQQNKPDTPPLTAPASAKAKQPPADDAGWLPPGEDPDNRLMLPLIKHIAQDQRDFWTFPIRLRKDDLRWLLPSAAFTASVVASDSWIARQTPQSASRIKESKDLSNYAVFSLIGVTGASYLLGAATGSEHLRETGFLAGEAGLDSTVDAYILKEITRRPRPFEGNGHGTFLQGGLSFPSEHAALAWSVASVFAHEYPGKLTQILAYGTASAVTVSRITANQHFASDALVGSALGWYFGRQVYRRRHDPELGGTAWGGLLPEKSVEKTRDPANMGSPYVSLESWIYPALERLQAIGYVHSGYLGMRPWTRMECARLINEADENYPGGVDENASAGRMLADLKAEFAPEAARLEGAANLDVSVDSIYSRVTGISSLPLRDGYHFGQTIIDDYGRPYGEGVNEITGAAAYAVAGPFSFSLRGEYQHAPMVASDPQSVLQATASADGGVFPLPDGSPAINRFRWLDSSVGVTLRNFEVSFGKESLWLGPGESGALLLSNNAQPITMLRIDSVSPFQFPLLSHLLGPARINFFVGQLSGQNWVYDPPVSAGLNPGLNPNFLRGPNLSPQPFIHADKISFRPTANLEFGMGITAIFGGPGLPFTWHEFLRSYYGHDLNTASNPAKRFSGADFTYRVPGLRNWLTVYSDSLVGDEISPLGSARPMLNPGIYLPQIPKLPHWEARLEGFKGSGKLGEIYFDRRFRSGYTNGGNLIGSWSGRQSIGGAGWLKYSFTPKDCFQLAYRHEEVDHSLAGGGRLNDFGVDGAFKLASNWSAEGGIQYERWSFPSLRPTPQSDVTASLQLTFYPRWRVRR